MGTGRAPGRPRKIVPIETATPHVMSQGAVSAVVQRLNERLRSLKDAGADNTIKPLLESARDAILAQNRDNKTMRLQMGREADKLMTQNLKLRRVVRLAFEALGPDRGPDTEKAQWLTYAAARDVLTAKNPATYDEDLDDAD